MTKKIIITAETGSDITEELAQQFGIILIPMHVSMGGETLDDGTFAPEEICAYYKKTGKVPTTSGSTPYDFEVVYDKLFDENPELQVLHLAYSAVTTCSYHSCELAIEGKTYEKNVRIVDTKHVCRHNHVGVDCLHIHHHLWKNDRDISCDIHCSNTDGKHAEP